MAPSTVTRKARPHQRYYLKSGDQVPGVTTILSIINKPALVPWANNLGLQGIKSTEYVDELAGIGTLAHAMIAHHLGGPPPDVDDYSKNQIDRAENSVLSFREWAKGKELITYGTEVQLVSEELRYGGTADWHGSIDGVDTLLDLKTGKAIYDDHLYQIAAYGHLLAENGHPLEAARVVQVGRGENVEFGERVVLVDGLPAYFNVFKAALNLYDAIRLATKERRRRRW